MKLVTYRWQGPSGVIERIGAWVDSNIIDLNWAYGAFLDTVKRENNAKESSDFYLPPEMVRFLEKGTESRKAAEDALAYVQDELKAGRQPTGLDGERLVIARSEVKLLSPVPRPTTLRDGVSFLAHAIKGLKAIGQGDKADALGKIPGYYMGNPYTVIGTEEPIIWPQYTEKLDFELEFGIFIGKRGKNISKADAPAYIAGYSIFNDVSARDRQTEEMKMLLGPAKGKHFDSGNVIGPCMVTPEGIDPLKLQYAAKVNGEVWAEGTTSDMFWSFPDFIEYISQDETLYPGDFIGSGTVPGGCGLELQRWIKPGDVVELEIDKIGVLRNKVIKA